MTSIQYEQQRKEHLVKNSLLLAVVIAAGILIIPTRPAHAYIDPGTGSYVVQAVVGTALAGVYLVTSSWRTIRSKVQQLFSKKKHDS